MQVDVEFDDQDIMFAPGLRYYCRLSQCKTFENSDKFDSSPSHVAKPDDSCSTSAVELDRRYLQGAIAKWLQRQIRNLFLFEGAGSNPAGVGTFCYSNL